MIKTFFLQTEIRSIIKSLATTSFVSCLCGVASLTAGKSFWATFCIATAVQFMLGYALATYTFYNYKKSIYLAELEKIENLSTILNCAYCNVPNLVTFLPEADIELKCEKCKNTSSVKLHFTVARHTTNLPTALAEPQQTHNIKL